MLPEEVKTPQWKVVEEKILMDIGEEQNTYFQISDELRSKYQKNSKNIQNLRGLKTDMIDLTEQ